mgnify:CR=1 FL=1
MKGFKYILAGCAMLAFGSCGDFLKEYSQDTDYVRSWRDLDELLIGSAYQPLYAAATLSTVSDPQYFLHFLADELDETSTSVISGNMSYDGKERVFGYYTWQARSGQNETYTGYNTENQSWQDYYNRINVANNIIAEAAVLKEAGEEGRRGRLKVDGEARFLRAFYYFNLVQCWGDVPFKTSSTQSVDGLQIARTPKEQIYDFICKEMEESADHLKTASENGYLPGSVTKSVAWGILARVYMFRAGECFRDGVAPDPTLRKTYFTKAGTFAQKVMHEGHTLAPNYWDYFIDQCSDKYNTTGKESIWEAEFTGNYSTDTRTEGRVGNIIGIQAPDLSSKAELTGKADPDLAIVSFGARRNCMSSMKQTETRTA